MRLSKVTQKIEISGVPIIGREKLLQAIDLYASDPPPVDPYYTHVLPTRNSKIIRATDNLSEIDSKEILLERLKALILEKLDRDRSFYKHFSEAVEPFNGMSLAIRALDIEKKVYVLKLTRHNNESLEEELAKMHGVERALNSISIDIYLVRDGDEIKINFEELLRSLDSVEGLNTNGLQGENVLDEITARGRKEDKFSLRGYDFPVTNGLKTNMYPYSITEDYPLSRNRGVCQINGHLLIAPLEKNDSPRIQFQITGATSDPSFSGEPIIDDSRKKAAIAFADSIESVFKQMVPNAKGSKPQQNQNQNWFLRMLSGLSGSLKSRSA